MAAYVVRIDDKLVGVVNNRFYIRYLVEREFAKRIMQERDKQSWDTVLNELELCVKNIAIVADRFEHRNELGSTGGTFSVVGSGIKIRVDVTDLFLTRESLLGEDVEPYNDNDND